MAFGRLTFVEVIEVSAGTLVLVLVGDWQAIQKTKANTKITVINHRDNFTDTSRYLASKYFSQVIMLLIKNYIRDFVLHWLILRSKYS